MSEGTKRGLQTHIPVPPVVPRDHRCPTCHKFLAFDDGLHYCDQDGTMGEDRCPDALKRYRPEDDDD